MSEFVGSIYATYELRTDGFQRSMDAAIRSTQNLTNQMSGVSGTASSFNAPASAASGFGSRMDAATRSAGSLADSAPRVSSVFGTSFKDAASQADNFSSHIDDLFGKIKNVALIGGTAVLGLGTAFVKSAAEMQTGAKSMEILTGNTQVANKLFGELANYANNTPFEFKDVSKAATTMLGFGIESNKVLGYTKNLGDISASTGADFGSLATVFGQVNAAGRLMGQDSLQLINNHVPIMNMLAKEMGINLSDVKKRMEEGAISADIFNSAIVHATEQGGYAFKGTDVLAQTLTGRISTMKDAFFELGRRILGVSVTSDGLKIDPNGVFQKLTDAVPKITKYLQDSTPAIQNFMKGLIDNGPTILKVIAGILAALAYLKIVTVVAAGIKTMTMVINGVRAATTLWGVATAIAGGPFTLIAAAIVAVIAVLVFLQLKFNIFGKALNFVKAVFNDVVAAFNIVVAAFKNPGVSNSGGVVGFLQNLGKIARGVFDFLVYAWNVVVAAFKIYIAAIVIEVKVFIAIFQFVWKVLTAVFNGIVSVLQWVGNMFVTIFNAVVAVVTAVISTIVTIITTLFNIWVAIWTAIFKVVGVIIALVLAIVITIFQAIFAFISFVLTSVWNFFVTVWNAISGTVIGILSAIWNFIVGVFTGIWNTISSVLSTIWNGITTIWNAIWKTITTVATAIWNTISTVFTAIWNTITTVLNTVWTFIVGVWNTISDFIGGVVSAIWNRVSTGFQNIWNAISGAVSGAWNSVTDFFGKIWNTISTTVGNVISKVGELGGQIVSKVANFGSILVDSGRNLIQGLIDGILGMGSKLASTITSFIKDKVPGPVLKVLGIHSPSKLFDKYGQYTMQGFANGVTGMANTVSGAVTGVFSNLPAAGGLGMGSVGVGAATYGGGGTGGQVTINLNGDQNFSNRADIDYFMNELGKRTELAKRGLVG